MQQEMQLNGVVLKLKNRLRLRLRTIAGHFDAYIYCFLLSYVGTVTGLLTVVDSRKGLPQRYRKSNSVSENVLKAATPPRVSQKRKDDS